MSWVQLIHYLNCLLQRSRCVGMLSQAVSSSASSHGKECATFVTPRRLSTLDGNPVMDSVAVGWVSASVIQINY